MNLPPGNNLPQMNADDRTYKHVEITEKVIGIFYEVYNEGAIEPAEVNSETTAAVVKSLINK